MKKTKDRILETSLKLFNQYGLAKVTLRTIAKEMGISQGNLNYHFKKRANIIEALYFQLVKNIDNNMKGHQSKTIDIGLLYASSSVIMNQFYDYRFFLLDFVQIIRENEKIRSHYKELTIKRQNQFQQLFMLFVEHGIMRKEILPNEYQYLYNRFQIMGDFWISSATITHNKISNKIVAQYSDIIQQAIFPYLTKKGREQYFLRLPVIA